jgi:hypothetical protein
MMKFVAKTHKRLRGKNNRKHESDYGRRYRYVRSLSIDCRWKNEFACIDGPEFDAHQVDFDESNCENIRYTGIFERHAYEKTCNLFKQEVK